MKLRFFSSLFIFISAYSPLAIIFLIQDFDFVNKQLLHPVVTGSIIVLALFSCLTTWVSVGFLKTSSPPITVTSISNRSSELINYTLPYIIAFLAMEPGNIKALLCFGLFMVIMFWLTVKTNNIFINPMLILMGYNLYDVQYVKDDIEYGSYFLVKGESLKKNDRCKIVKISEWLYVVADRNLKD